MPETTILLASASPRRRELMHLLNVPYEALSTDIDETPRTGESAAALVERLSRAKAQAARSQHLDALIIACDTSVELPVLSEDEGDAVLLGKPRDEAEARAMLGALRGRAHFVYGGIAICDDAGTETLVVCTRVWMRNYTAAEVEAYLATGDPMDKAAAYGVQNPDFRPVARVEGCFANVMGLALCHLYNALAHRLPLPEPCLECQRHPDQDCTVAELVAERRVGT
jgi:nucleoside triphosphate pyrophosphatase